MEIIVFGTGCLKCEELEQNCKDIIHELGIDAQLVKISDTEEMFARGVLMTPALMINGKLLVSGKVPTRSTLRSWIQKAI